MQKEASNIQIIDVNEKHNQFLQGDKSREFYDLKLKIATIKQDLQFLEDDHRYKVQAIKEVIEMN